MSQNNVKRNYFLTDSKLSQFIANFCSVLERDLSDLIPYGMSQSKIDMLHAKCISFTKIDFDKYSIGVQRIATDNKNTLMTRLQESIRQMNWRAESKWGADASEYQKLGAQNISLQPEDSLLRISRSMYDLLNEHLPELSDFGLSETILEDFQNLTNEFEEAITAQNNAIVQRQADKKQRIQMGNELYRELSIYCDIGKKLYAKTNPAKYYNYVIYDKPSKGKIAATID